MKRLYSLKFEQHVISGLLKYPHRYHEVSAFLSYDDFADPSRVNGTLYKVIGNMISAGQPIDPILLSQKLSDLKITFEDGINIHDYVQSLSLKQIKEESIVEVAKSIKKFSIRRAVVDNAEKIKRNVLALDFDASFDDIISIADSTYNASINIFFNKASVPQNIFEDMEANIEERGNNPREDMGLRGPFPRVQEMCGSLLRPGNITVIASRYGVGKTTLALDFCYKTAVENDVPVLHMDNGEMSYTELQNRTCAALSGVPLYYIETGKWRNNPHSVEAVRAIWPKIKKHKFFYYNVGGLDYEEMINTARRWYYSVVGRGNTMIWSFDYIKVGSIKESDDSFWIGIGNMLNRIKTFIQSEIVFDNEPKIAFFSSVQANRLGISRTPNAVNTQENEDSEAVIGLSDMIGQIASHLFILRKKTPTELMEEGDFGTHKFILLKSRHMGKNPSRMFDLVEMPDGSKKKNFINLEIVNFSVSEKGDLIDLLNRMSIRNARPRQDGQQPAS